MFFFLICPLQIMTWLVLFWVFSWHFQEVGLHRWMEVTSPLGTSRDLHSSSDTCRSPRVPGISTPNSSACLFNHQSLCSHVLFGAPEHICFPSKSCEMSFCDIEVGRWASGDCENMQNKYLIIWRVLDVRENLPHLAPCLVAAVMAQIKGVSSYLKI